MTKGQRIKSLRESLQISQTDLAKQINVSKQTLYKYEQDIISNIPSDVIERLSEHLKCSPEYIMGWEHSSDEVEKAMAFYEQYKNAIPQIQTAVESLLKSSQSDS